MKRFFIRFILFCLAPLPFLFLFGNIIDAGLRKSRYSSYAEWNDLFGGRINADVLINGSSRAWLIFSPQIIDSVLHLNSYNLGMDGADFHFQYQRFKLYLKYNKKPKYVIQEVGYTRTLVRYTSIPATVQFLPYLKDSTMWDIVKKGDQSFGFLDRYFPAYKYNNEFDVINEGILSFFGKGIKKGLKYKGYKAYNGKWDSSFSEFKKANPNGWSPAISPESVEEFKDFLEFCKANDIKVIMANPPAYREATDMIDPIKKKEVLSIFNQFAKEYNAPYYDYENDTLCYNNYYFYNSQHLNKIGSELYSLEFARDLKKEIK